MHASSLAKVLCCPKMSQNGRIHAVGPEDPAPAADPNSVTYSEPLHYTHTEFTLFLNIRRNLVLLIDRW
jgi:hypothetical protein